MAFLLNTFCYRLAVYLGNYAILVFILSIRPIPFSFMGGQAGNLPHTQWGEIAMRDTFQALHRLCAPSLAFFDYFFTVSLTRTLCVSLLHWHAHVLLREDWQQQMIPMMHHSSNCSWHTHTLALRHTNKGTLTMRTNIFSSIFSEWFANIARRLKWTGIHTRLLCLHWLL